MVNLLAGEPGRRVDPTEQPGLPRHRKHLFRTSVYVPNMSKLVGHGHGSRSRNPLMVAYPTLVGMGMSKNRGTQTNLLLFFWFPSKPT